MFFSWCNKAFSTRRVDFRLGRITKFPLFPTMEYFHLSPHFDHFKRFSTRFVTTKHSATTTAQFFEKILFLDQKRYFQHLLTFACGFAQESFKKSQLARKLETTSRKTCLKACSASIWLTNKPYDNPPNRSDHFFFEKKNWFFFIFKKVKKNTHFNTCWPPFDFNRFLKWLSKKFYRWVTFSMIMANSYFEPWSFRFENNPSVHGT